MFPRLFHIGNFNMPTYGLLVSLGVLLGLWISVRNSQKQGIDPDKAWNLGIIVVMCGIVGAKVLYIIVDWSDYAAHPGEIFSLNTLQAGGVFSGGLIGAFAAAAWYIRRHRMPALATCDAFAPGLAIGHAIGRVGCFAAGCCFGKPTDHFWGVTFTNPIAHELVGTPIGEALQPTQLFESAVELLNFFILAWMLKRKKFDGQVIGTYFFLYGVARFFLEYLRGDPGRGEVFGGIITGTQLVALCLIAAGGLIWWLRPGMKQVPVQATR
ncbi:MAG TPA: prolipoprotein diacylglyceryl transferase [Terriglobales bacterium]|nr:prolipoprotein diacylglyceryl transferase [Terriglobales bacterium]